MGRRNCLAVLLLLIGSTAQGASFTHNETDAVTWAFIALQEYSDIDRPFIRFVWIPPYGDTDLGGVMAEAVNAAASQSRILYKSDRHAGGWLLAYDLRRLAQGKQLINLIQIWDDQAQFDPYSHILALNVKCKTCGGTGIGLSSTGVKCSTCSGSGRVNQNRKAKGVAILAPHVEQSIIAFCDKHKIARTDEVVAALTKSTGGVYRADWFLERLLSNLKGNYLEFRQIDVNFSFRGLSPLESHLYLRGYSVKASRNTAGERGALILRSGVTGKNRVIVSYPGVGSKMPLAVSYDTVDDRIAPDEAFVRNLVNFDNFFDASEIFVPLKNDLLEFIIADANGNIQRAVPPDVAADYTKEHGFTNEVEGALSCIICHAPEGGYKTQRNDFEYILGADTEFFGEDFSSKLPNGKILNRVETLELITTRFGTRDLFEPDGSFRRASRDYNLAVAFLTNYKFSTTGLSPVSRAGAKVKEITFRYRYDFVDARIACLELGVKTKNREEARRVFRAIVPPTFIGDEEDIYLALIRNGAEVLRADWEAVYSEAARRFLAVKLQYKK